MKSIFNSLESGSLRRPKVFRPLFHKSINRKKRKELFNKVLENPSFVKCEICFSPLGKNEIQIDHCHETGEIRGTLCQACNSLLGYAEDDPEILLSAISYLNNNLKKAVDK